MPGNDPYAAIAQQDPYAAIASSGSAPTAPPVPAPGMAEMRPGTSGPAPQPFNPWAGHPIDEAVEHVRDWLTRNAPMVMGTIGGIAGGLPGAALGGSLAGAAENPDHPVQEAAKQGAEQAAYELGGRAIGKAIKAIPGAGQAAMRFFQTFGPSAENVAGQDIPQLVGERAPNSMAGQIQRIMKRTGVNPEAFEDFAQNQMASAKEAVRKAFGMATGEAPAPGEPYAMGKAASKTLQAQANPLYSQVWASGTEVPFDQSQITEGPIRDAWNRVMRRNGVPAEQQLAPNKSIGLMNQFRSELRSTAEASRDPVSGRLDSNGRIANEWANDIDDKMRKSLSVANPDALQMWEQANDLWAQSHAIDKVADALAKTTEGTVPEMQAGGQSVIQPTTMKGASLVKQLNRLDRNGALQRAFPDGGKAIHAVADMLDRAQKVKAGDPSMWRFNSMMRYGAELALAGTAGLAAQKAHPGGGLFAAAAVLSFLGARFGERSLVNVMTDREALPLVQKLASATSSSQVSTAAQALYQMMPTLLRGASLTSKGPAPRIAPSPQQASGIVDQNSGNAYSGAGVPTQ